jgi:hypothetical protein
MDEPQNEDAIERAINHSTHTFFIPISHPKQARYILRRTNFGEPPNFQLSSIYYFILGEDQLIIEMDKWMNEGRALVELGKTGIPSKIEFNNDSESEQVQIDCPEHGKEIVLRLTYIQYTVTKDNNTSIEQSMEIFVENDDVYVANGFERIVPPEIAQIEAIPDETIID